MKDLKIGCAINSVVNTDRDSFSVDQRFKMVKESGAFDYIEKTPPTGELEVYMGASQKYGIPIRTGGFFYTLGRDEPLFEWHMRMCKVVGSVAMNVQVLTNGADGKMVTNQQVADFYVWAVEVADKNGVVPSLEVHIGQWSEHFGRVAQVGEILEKRGVPLKLTLDHSHVIFKIDNPKEQEVQGMKADIDAGKLELDPFKPNNVTSQWIAKNWIAHMHARPSAPNNPVNVWATLPDGSYGRGIQYPFLKPKPGEWHSPWDESKLEPWKEVVRNVLKFHATHPESVLGQITTEMIPGANYGMGARYSIFEHSAAVAKWIRGTWNDLQKGNK